MGQIGKSLFGRAGDRDAHLFTLRNPGGMVAKITDYGTILTELHVPGRGGKTADVVLGFDALEEYLKGHPMFGAVVGRVANRIAGGRFTLDGKEYRLAVNNGPHHLHGGIRGFDKYVWESEAAETPEGPSVRMSRTSPDGEEGYPGTLRATVSYTLTGKNELRIEMTAVTDAPTIVNLSNHTYWNLAGHGSGKVLGQELQIYADRYTPSDAALIPTGAVAPVEGTPYDFRVPKPIGKDIGRVAPGYDTNFVVDGEPGTLRRAARASDPASGRVLELLTTQPGVHLYTGNKLAPRKGKGGAEYGPHGGFCLETQHFPDSVNKPHWPTVVLRPGETYRHMTVHRFPSG
jgi:aldose 1-epimerase